VVRNEGTTAVKGIRLSATPPAGWRVTFRPSTIPNIAPKRTGKVTAIITPSGEAVAGDYVVTLTSSAEQSTSNADIRVSVSPSRLFGFLGLVIIVGAAYALFWVFRRYGRR
ncbi:MAG: NEW3 domain-containing protein, partial [Actinomycetota bacterium]